MENLNDIISEDVYHAVSEPEDEPIEKQNIVLEFIAQSKIFQDLVDKIVEDKVEKRLLSLKIRKNVKYLEKKIVSYDELIKNLQKAIILHQGNRSKKKESQSEDNKDVESHE